MVVVDIIAGDILTTPPKVGDICRMNFKRGEFTWTKDHIPGSVIKPWNYLNDVAGDECLKRKKEFHSWLDEMRKHPESFIDPMPDFIEREKLQRGTKFFLRYWPAVFECFTAALFGGFGCQEACVVLLESRYWADSGVNGLKDTADRLKETALWLYDICAHGADGFKPGGVSWAASSHVRYLHARQRKALSEREDWDFEKWGMPISQVQLAGTLLGSSVLLLQGIEEGLGITVENEDKEGFVMLWATIGHLFGIREDLNPCAKGYDYARCRMESILAYAIPEKPDPKLTAKLTKHILDSSVEHVLPFLTPGSMAAFPRTMLGDAYADDVGLPKASTFNRIITRIRLFILVGMLKCYKIPILGTLMEFYFRLVFRLFVKYVRYEQPKCRFGTLA